MLTLTLRSCLLCGSKAMGLLVRWLFWITVAVHWANAFPNYGGGFPPMHQKPPVYKPPYSPFHTYQPAKQFHNPFYPYYQSFGPPFQPAAYPTARPWWAQPQTTTTTTTAPPQYPPWGHSKASPYWPFKFSFGQQQPPLKPLYQQPPLKPFYQQPFYQQPFYQQPPLKPFYQQPFYQQPPVKPFYQQPPVKPFYQQPPVKPFYQQPPVKPYYQQPPLKPYYQLPQMPDYYGHNPTVKPVGFPFNPKPETPAPWSQFLPPQLPSSKPNHLVKGPAVLQQLQQLQLPSFEFSQRSGKWFPKFPKRTW